VTPSCTTCFHAWPWIFRCCCSCVVASSCRCYTTASNVLQAPTTSLPLEQSQFACRTAQETHVPASQRWQPGVRPQPCALAVRAHLLGCASPPAATNLLLLCTCSHTAANLLLLLWCNRSSPACCHQLHTCFFLQWLCLAFMVNAGIQGTAGTALKLKLNYSGEVRARTMPVSAYRSSGLLSAGERTASSPLQTAAAFHTGMISLQST
jgi:hypothetical protein